TFVPYRSRRQFRFPLTIDRWALLNVTKLLGKSPRPNSTKPASGGCSDGDRFTATGVSEGGAGADGEFNSRKGHESLHGPSVFGASRGLGMLYLWVGDSCGLGVRIG
ncbi:MAG: hypothetical protein VX904_12105, partial [Planctomycetota bacterium]|nr:hypothetical protein [Planctomycetota bacterium]